MRHSPPPGHITLALENLGDRMVLRPVPMTRSPPRAVPLPQAQAQQPRYAGGRTRGGQRRRSAPRADELSVPLDAFALIALFAEEPAAEPAAE